MEKLLTILGISTVNKEVILRQIFMHSIIPTHYLQFSTPYQTNKSFFSLIVESRSGLSRYQHP
jgi:hypothetical protein